jgi:CarD family transcriptional regulator
MRFQSGDDVVHPDYGVGSIVRLEERQLAETHLRWYYVLAIDTTTTVWVPVHADGSTTLRAVIAKRDLDQYRAVLRGRPATLDHNPNKRRLDIKERLAHGSFQVTCEVVRDLASLGWYQRVSDVDAALLQKVRANLEREWAVATGLSAADTTREIDALLQTGRNAYKT